MPRAKPLVKHGTIAAKRGKPLRLAVVADTHSLPHAGGLAHLTALAPDAILHAGDIGDLAVLTRLEAIAPLHAVRGNIDGRDDGLADTLTLDVEAPGGHFRLLMTHIAVAGPKLRGDAARAAHAAKASLVVCGHSHVPFIGVDKGLTVFNPGSIGPRRFHLPIVFGVIEVGAKGVSLRHVDAETGKEWTP